MDIDPEYEIKIRLYDGNEQNIATVLTEYEQLREYYRDEGSVVSKVLSYFFEGLIAVCQGDIAYRNKDYTIAFKNYKDADRMLNRFKNSRNVQVRLDYLAARLIFRITGLLQVSEAKQQSNYELKETLFGQALENFNKEIELSNDMGETISSYAAFGRASFSESQFLLYKAKSLPSDHSGEAKKLLLKSRNAVRQACFINSDYKQAAVEIEDEIDDITKNRIVVKAEEHGDKATENSENGDFNDAAKDFRQASLFYKRASTLASDTTSRRYLLSSATIYEASELESIGNYLFRRENNTEAASIKFEEAAKQVEKAIALMGRFGSEVLEESFKSQRDYYRAMGLQSQAIFLFDQEQYKDAKSIFTQANELFDQAITAATNGENEVLVNLSNEAKGDITGYISMCDAMV